MRGVAEAQHFESSEAQNGQPFHTRPAAHFEHSRIVSVSTFRATSMGLSEMGTVYMWDEFLPIVSPTVLGAEFFTEAVGIYAKMPPCMGLGLAMGTQPRLGIAVAPNVDAAAPYEGSTARRKSKRTATKFSIDHSKSCPLSDLSGDLLQRLFDTANKSLCGSHTEGVTRLMGGPANASKAERGGKV